MDHEIKDYIRFLIWFLRTWEAESKLTRLPYLNIFNVQNIDQD